MTLVPWRVFNDQHYFLHSAFHADSRAQRCAKRLRKDGHCVELVKNTYVEWDPLWEVWVR